MALSLPPLCVMVLCLCVCAGTYFPASARAEALGPDAASSSSSSSLSSATSVPPEESLAHSMFSWDYSRYLGSLTWWNSWFPACKSRYQAPVLIDWEKDIIGSTDTLVIETTTGLPLRPFHAVVAYNSTFNLVRCEMAADEERFYIYWKPAEGSTAPVNKGPPFRLEKMVFLFPSEHQYPNATGGNTLLDAEIRYTFTSTGLFPLSEETPLTNTIDENTSVCFSILLQQVPDQEGRADIEMLLQQLMSGYTSGVTRITPQLPAFDVGLVHYKGSMTTPPCRGNVHHFVGGVPLPLETSTLQKLISYGPHWKDYRTCVDPDGRPIRRVAFNQSGLVATLRSTSYVPRFVIVDDQARSRELQEALALSYGVILAGVVSGILLLAVLGLLWERHTHQVPFSVTWRLPKSGREVFGVPVRYGQQTGRPKPLASADAGFGMREEEEVTSGSQTLETDRTSQASQPDTTRAGDGEDGGRTARSGTAGARDNMLPSIVQPVKKKQ